MTLTRDIFFLLQKLKKLKKN